MAEAVQRHMPVSRAIGLIGARGLIGGGFRGALAGRHVITLGRSAGDERRLDLDAEPPPGIFDGIDLLVHAGGVRDEDFARDPVAGMRRATSGTQTLYRAALEAGVRRFVHVSSAHVYGGLDRAIDENSPAAPRGDYAIAHRESELALASQVRAYGAVALAVRPNAVYGMSFDPARFERWFLVPYSFPKAALAGEIRVNAPHVKRNFVSTGMIARQSLALVERLDRPGFCALNAIGPDLLTMRAFAERCAEVANAKGLGPVRVSTGDNVSRPEFVYSTIHGPASMDSELTGFLEDYFEWLAGIEVNAIAGNAGRSPGTAHSPRGFT